MLRLQEKYNKKIVPAMIEKFGYKNKMAVPKIEKVIINTGFGKMIEGKGAGERKKVEEHIAKNLALITGQKPLSVQAKKSIAVFKLRQGMIVGLKTTLRGKRMYQFLEKLTMLVFPRSRDFRGLPLSSISEKGDLTIGFKEYTPFQEVKTDKEKGIFGLEVTIKTNAKTKKERIELLRQIGVPLQKNNKEEKLS